MDNIYVVGVGMTLFGKIMELNIKAITKQAVESALSDASIQKNDIEAAFFANCLEGYLEGQQMIRGPIALRAMGINGIPMLTCENACASGSTAFHLAVEYVRSGAADVALAVGVEKMNISDKTKVLTSFDSGWDISTIEENKNDMLSMGDGIEVPPGTESATPYSVFMSIYAAWARFHMKTFGTTQKQIAAVAAKNHMHSIHNPKSQYRVGFTVDEVLAARPITYPLTLPMCSPISDGGAAAIVCNKEGMKKLNIDNRRAIKVLSSVLSSGRNRSVEDIDKQITALAAKKAYECAGIGPEDISVAEVHDATALGEIIQVENLGLCPRGMGGPYEEAGDFSIGGKIPVNPSGGLESKGHPIAATGLGQIYELVTQLRGEAGPRQVEGARIAIQENGGGLIGIEEAIAHIAILGK